MGKSDDFMAKIKMTLVDTDGKVVGYKELKMMEGDTNFSRDLKKAMESMIGEESIESIEPAFHFDDECGCCCTTDEEDPFSSVVGTYAEACRAAAMINDFPFYKEIRTGHWIVDLIERHMEKLLEVEEISERYEDVELEEAKFTFYQTLTAKILQLLVLSKHSSAPHLVNSIIELPNFSTYCAIFPSEDDYRKEEPVKTFFKTVDAKKLIKQNKNQGGKEFARQLSESIQKYTELNEDSYSDDLEGENGRVYELLEILEEEKKLCSLTMHDVVQNASKVIFNAFKQYDPSIQMPRFEEEFKEERKRILAENLLNPNSGMGSTVH